MRTFFSRNISGRLRGSASTLKGQSSTSRDREIDIDQLTKISTKMIVASGVVIVLSYCAKEHFFPSGLSIGDSILFMFTSMMFGLFYGYVVGAAVFIGDPIATWIIRTRNNQLIKKAGGVVKRHHPLAGKENRAGVIVGIFHAGLMTVMRLFLVFLLALIYELMARPQKWVEAPLFAILMVLVGCFAKVVYVDDSIEFKKQPRLRSVLLICLAVIPFVLTPRFLAPMIDTTMSVIGVRIPNATIAIPADEYAFLRNLSKSAGRELGDCDELGGGKCLLVADILFQGIGERSLIRPHLPPNSPTSNKEIKDFRATVTSKTMQIASFTNTKN